MGKKKESINSESKVLEAAGIRLVRSGSQLFIHVERSEDEQRRPATTARAVASRVPNQLRDVATRVEEIFTACDAFDLLAMISALNLRGKQHPLSQTVQQGSSLKVEMAALLALRAPCRSAQRLLQMSDVEELEILLDQLERGIAFLTVTEELSMGQPVSTEVQSLRATVRLHEFLVYRLAYKKHLEQVLAELFSPFVEELRDRIGFSAEDAWILSETVERLMNRGLNDRLSDMSQQIKRCRDLLELEKADADTQPWWLLELTEKERNRKIERMGLFWAFALAGDVVSFEANKLASTASLGSNTSECFLATFSLSFGDAEFDFGHPTPNHALRERLLITDTVRYLAPEPRLLYWAIQPALENQLKQKNRVWHRYEQHRHTFVLDRSLTLLANVFKGCVCYKNLYYPIPASNERGESHA